MGRPPTRRDEKYAIKHSLVALLETLEEDGENVNWEALP